MPNIKSAIKRVSVIEKKTLQNNMIKSAYKTAIKTFEAAVAEGDKTKAEEIVDLAVEKGTPVVQKAAEDVRQQAIKVTKQVLKKLEGN